MRHLFAWAAALMLLAGFAQAQDAATSDPAQLVQGVAQGMLKDLDANRGEYRRDPTKINALAEKYLLPNFDTEYAGRLVLGQHWREASAEQRKRFVDAFTHSMINNYGSSLVDFTADRLKVFPSKIAPGADRATVRTEVARSNGSRVPVNYSMRRTPDGWKAWDVVIEGISYVKSFRDDFGSEIDQKGLDEVIDRMEKGGKPGAAPPGGKS